MLGAGHLSYFHIPDHVDGADCVYLHWSDTLLLLLFGVYDGRCVITEMISVQVFFWLLLLFF